LSPADALPRWRVFPPVGLGVLMATLDISVVNIALPSLQRGLAVALPTLEWVVVGYVATITALLLTAGRLADRVGRRRTYAHGLVLFTLASLACAAAPAVAVLIAARVLQGIGASLLAANGAALLVAAFPPEQRGRALGAFGAMVGVGLALGPVVGGMLVEALSWRWIFLINLPLGVLAWVLLHQRVRADAPDPAAPPLDLPAAALWCGALAGLLLALSRGPDWGWRDPRVLTLAGGGGALLAAFLAHQAHAPRPLLPPALLVGRLGGALALTLASQAIGVAVGFHLPLHLEGVYGWDAARCGRWFALLPVSALLVAPLAGRLSDRHGPRGLGAGGMALTAAGLLALAGVGVREDLPRLGFALAAIGVGQGLFAVPNSSAVLSLLPAAHLGLASGLQGTARNLGLAGGSAAMAALVASMVPDAGGVGALDAAHRAAFAEATRWAGFGWAGVALAGAAAAWALRLPAPEPPAEGRTGQ
jgi:EmrB/QacA subfamily drug resistance transporter